MIKNSQTLYRETFKSLYMSRDIKLFLLLLVILAVIVAGCGGDDDDDSCFLPGTLITLEDNSQIPIENVKVGDKVISLDENLNRVVSEVLETESPMRNDYYIITFENGKELKLTDEHPLYIKSGKYEGWGSIIPEASIKDSGIITRKIEFGDSILNIENKWIKIAGIKHVKEKVKTYNLKKVDKTNTFFAEGFLAHNKNHGNNTPDPDAPLRNLSHVVNESLRFNLTLCDPPDVGVICAKDGINCNTTKPATQPGVCEQGPILSCICTTFTVCKMFKNSTNTSSNLYIGKCIK